MANSLRYFVGNWKMFGVPSSYKILDKIYQFYQKDQKNKKKYRLIMAPPNTLIHDFSKRFKNKKIIISSQNFYHQDLFGSYTGKVSPFMIKRLGVNYTLLGHSECRSAGETDKILKQKFSLALKNNLKVIYCIGENKIQKRTKSTVKVLKKQILKVISKKSNFNNIIIAYEPIWSIGTGLVPKNDDLFETINFIKKKVKDYKVLYGGSVNSDNVNQLKLVHNIDGFLVGGASQNPKKFIDIIKKTYN